jgi:hypothetical protein
MKINSLLPLFLALMLFGACKNGTTVVETDTGTFRGNITLFDANGDTLPNYAGATVQIQGTTFQATSSANGDWQINNVPTGIYNILLTKPGFDTLTIPQYQFSGAGTAFIMSTAIQALPMDSLVFSISDSIGYRFSPDSNGTDSGYLGILTMTGKLAGPDSLLEARFNIKFGAADSIGSQINTYLVNDQVPTGITKQYACGNAPNYYKNGTIVTVWSIVWAKIPSNFGSFAYFQQAISPYSIQRTITLP